MGPGRAPRGRRQRQDHGPVSGAGPTIGVDTSTATGKFLAHIMAAVAELEREIISERTRDALHWRAV